MQTQEMNSLKGKRLIAVAVIFLLSLAVYINTLDNELVRDDNLQVLENKWITDYRYIPEILTSAVWDFYGTPGATNQYRPTFHLFLMVGYAFSGSSTWGYHLVNILFHALSSVLVFLVISRFIASAGPPRGSPEGVTDGSSESGGSFNILLSGFAALLFATHPINTEPVAWISGVPEVSFTFFYLLSLYLYIRSRKPGDINYIASVLFFFISACSKETAATLPVVLIAYELIVAKRGVILMIKRLIPFGVAGVIYTALRFWTLKGMIPLKAEHVAELSSFQLLLNVPPLVVKYIGKLLLPTSLNFDYVFDPVFSISEPRAFISAIISIGIVIIIWRLRNRASDISFALLLIFLPLLPALYIPALGLNTFTERYLYLPTVGFALLVAYIVNKGVEFFGSRGYSLRTSHLVVTLFFIVTITLYSYGTVKRNALWQNGYTLWGDTVKKSPASRIARNNYAIELSKRGFQDEALVHLEAAILIDSSFSLTYNNLGIVYASKGMLKEAVSAFESSLEISPYDPDARRNLSKALGLLSKDDK